MGSGSPDISRAGRVATNPSGAGAPATAAPLAPQTPATPATGASADTFRRLSPDVAAGKLPEQDARMLAAQSAVPGVIGEAQAIRAARMAAALPADGRAQLQQAVDGAKTDTQRAFIYKALAAGHPVSEVADFAAQIRDLPDQELLKSYTLSGPLGSAETPGLRQQFATSCVPSVAETLHGDADPIYARNVHAQNGDVHANAGVQNGPLQQEEQQLLEQAGGGTAAPDGRPTDSAKIDDVLNSVSRYTGVTYHQSHLDKNDRRASDDQEKLIDQMVGQLQQGIATPFEVRTPDDTVGHEAVAIAVDGTGDKARFLVHDPASGDTAWLSRRALIWGAQDTFPSWERAGLAGVAVAQEQLPALDQAAR
jgi:hypothetical protein